MAKNFGTDFNVVMEKLQSFETADALAEYFRDYGIVARPRDARSCAIAKFVAVETGLNIVTNLSAVWAYESYEEINYKYVIEHSAAMADFVECYDMGYYPYLVEEGYGVAIESCCEDCDDYED